MNDCNHTTIGVVNGSSCQSVAGATIVSPILMFLAGVMGMCSLFMASDHSSYVTYANSALHCLHNVT